MVDCEYCGETTDDPQACAECGGVYCHDHEKPLMHECPEIEGAVGDDVFDPSATSESGGPLEDAGGTLVWAGIVLGTVVLLVGLGVATGVIAPGAILPQQEPPEPSAGTTAPGETDFSEGEFRRQVLGSINDWRAERNRSALETVDGRSTVAESIAQDMASVQYFQNSDAQDDTRFAPKQRLADNGYGCAESGNVLYRTAYDKPIDTDEGQTRLTTTEEAAEWVSDHLRDELGQDLFDPEATTHSLGVHITDDRLVYIVYVTC